MMKAREKTTTIKSLLISGEFFPPGVGGIPTYMASLVEALGPERVCCLTGVKTKCHLDFKSQGVRIFRRPSVFSQSSLLEGGAWLAAVIEIMWKERPKVVQLATLYDGHLGMWLNKWFGLPYVVYAHGNEILNALQAQWEGHRCAIQSADCVLANSRYTADLVRQCAVQADRIEIVYPGCDAEQFRPIQLSSEYRQGVLGRHATSKVILTVGRLVRRKGHDRVIQSLPRILKRHPDTCYLIVGDGPVKQELVELARRLGVADKVIFLDRAEDADLPKIYSLSDVFVMPSREDLAASDVEGFGIVFLEANACGKPVVGARSGGMADAVIDGETGLLVPSNDEMALAEAIGRLIGDMTLGRRLGEQGRNRVVRDFAWQSIGDRVAAIIEGLTFRRNRAA
jgi:phosphatidylinositol alpha-1,6-mannosyltransferase